VTRFYDGLGILKYVNDNKKFVPRLHSKDKQLITLEDKKFDQANFEESKEINTESLFKYYNVKGC
jgi:hypothetical protein